MGWPTLVVRHGPRRGEGAVVLPPEDPPSLHPAGLGGAADAGFITCPVCDNLALASAGTCPHCGFPFSCDITPQDYAPQRRRMASWRIVLGVMALIFFFSGGLLYRGGFEAYQGSELSTLTQLQPDTTSTIPLNGPPEFAKRTQLALGLLKARAPEFYQRLESSVARIDYLSPEELNSPLGRKVHMEGIGALSTPETRRIQVLPLTAFPDGDGVNDRALFNYGAVLVHELRHIELHWSQQAPGGWQEEVLCEQAALGFLKEAGAPAGLIADKEVYLADPQAKRYQDWYDWYKQFK